MRGIHLSAVTTTCCGFRPAAPTRVVARLPAFSSSRPACSGPQATPLRTTTGWGYRTRMDTPLLESRERKFDTHGWLPLVLRLDRGCSPQASPHLRAEQGGLVTQGLRPGSGRTSSVLPRRRPCRRPGHQAARSSSSGWAGTCASPECVAQQVRGPQRSASRAACRPRFLEGEPGIPCWRPVTSATWRTTKRLSCSTC